MANVYFYCDPPFWGHSEGVIIDETKRHEQKVTSFRISELIPPDGNRYWFNVKLFRVCKALNRAIMVKWMLRKGGFLREQ